MAKDGVWMIVEPFANDLLKDNLNSVGRVYYAASTFICTPASLSQEVGLGLGAQAGEYRLRQVATEAGFNSFRRATETPLDCARVCAEVIALSRRASEHGYLNVISDGGVGVLAGFTALRSAALNVYINAPALKDRAFAAAATAELEKLLESCAAESEAVYSLVRNKLG